MDNLDELLPPEQLLQAKLEAYYLSLLNDYGNKPMAREFAEIFGLQTI